MQLTDYIQGKKHGKEANRLEREAINDPFLQDAIDGFDAVSGDHLSAIHDLENQLQKNLSSPKRLIPYRWITIGVAATIALIMGIGSLMHVDVKAPVVVATKTTHSPTLTPKLTSDTVVQSPSKAIARHIRQAITVPVAVAEERTQTGATLNLEMTNSDVILDTMPYTTTTPLSQVSSFRSMETNAIDKQVSATTSVLKPTTGKVKGVVLDEAGEPLIGATVSLTGTDAATVTGANGHFELPAKGTNNGLIVKYIGYDKADVPVLSDSNIIRLKPSTLTLNEVVTVGYGAKRKRSLGSLVTGSINSTSKTKLKPSGISFGEKEFKVYFEHYRTRSLCDDKGGTVRASFTINPAGKPTNLTIIKSTCDDLSRELIRLLNDSPAWTETGQKVELKIVVK